VTVALLIGEFKTGRIVTTLTGGDITGLRWTDELNAAGSITGVTIPEGVVRQYDLRQHTHGWRTFLAVERDGRIVQAGPVTTRTWDWQAGTLTLGASGIWSYLDRVFIRPVGLVRPYQKKAVTISGKSLGGIARALVEQMTVNFAQTQVPIVLPPDEPGEHTETFPMWKLLTYGEQLRQITQRAVDAPDVRFPARRRADDPRFIEWVMQVGTELVPDLSQGGPDWVFDTTAPKSPVLGIGTDEDATPMAQRVWATGNGMEEDILMALAQDDTLLNLGWPRTEVDESHSTVEWQDTLQGHADALLARSARPIEVWQVTVRAEAAREVLPGDYCQVITGKDPVTGLSDPWLPDGARVMRTRAISGDLTDTLTLEMYPMQAQL
jgi:hypothetical protein